METKTLPGTSVSTNNLNMLLDSLTTDQLYKLIEATKGELFCFPDKHCTFEIYGVTRRDSMFFVHFADSVMGIDHVQLRVTDLTSRVVNCLLAAIDKVL